ncbi:succinyl-diaminopimelate desuccinylase [Candidatus Vidania fulgoroideorum]
MISFLLRLLSRISITPNDNGCQKIIKYFLKKIGFQTFTYKKKNVTNSIFFRYSNKYVDYLFSGHSDVVPENEKKIKIINKKIFYRGSVDMKGAIICFCAAVKIFSKTNYNKNIMITITSDEEGKAENGTKTIAKKLIAEKFYIKNIIIGEPTSKSKVLDIVKNGRRGSMNLKLTICGKQGHSAYPELALNPINPLCKIIDFISNIKIKNNSIQVTVLKTKNNTINVIPKNISAFINIRYTREYIKKILIELRKLILSENISFKIKKISNSSPFFFKSKKILKKILKIKKDIIISKNQGGTSDGRFFKKITDNLVEVGLVNKTAHKKNENSKIKDLFELFFFYYRIIS